MKKVKYYYNTHSLRYEKYDEPWRIKLFRILSFISAALVFAFLIVWLAYTYLDSPKEKALKREIAGLQLQYELLNSRLEQMQVVLSDLQDRDDNIYRVIFEAEPIGYSVRGAGTGGTSALLQFQNFDQAELMAETTEKLEQIRRQMYIQSKSYDEITSLLKKKEEVLASIPAIQPISNKNLRRIGSGFGMRIDPIYRIPKMHEGIDFTAPVGTPVYATGNGLISDVEYGNRGYGNHIIISHMVGYKTLYAHLSRVAVKKNQRVNRGDLIGYVGSTGKSTAPHLHYEVMKGETKIDPVNFFFNDLTPQEYEEMLLISSQSNQSFD